MFGIRTFPKKQIRATRDGLAVFARLERIGQRVELELALGLLLPVAFHAGLFEDGLDVLVEGQPGLLGGRGEFLLGRRRGGECDREGRAEGEGDADSFHVLICC